MPGTPPQPFPNLTTGRAILRMPEATEQNAAAVVAYFSRNRDHLEKWGPIWPVDFLSVGHWMDQLQQNLDDYQNDRAVRCFLMQRDQPDLVIGAASLTNIVRGSAQFCHLGYSIDQKWEGKSLMKESLQSLTSFGFVAMNLHRIMANYQPTNDRSGWLLRSLGFTVEGYARDYLNIDGRLKDHILTSLTNPNWQK